ncbi:MurR/RpiR family transcriptional regulator [Dyella caseinilytica]|uniref:MurR/RpiR family transcriptional regulator n=1 Tax=Dyella caseinilytica TaxID=1849581 RepID=A0ABX7H0A1_9GAMM|nr:MurR/RpiR family transcriptional regulator [Dyella caseinilytica]QRN55332.1 MurR/RpiR family transcriptional regulator [Dyella caseinilytica]GGA00986.1 RpiR family transcriptional regulator [Dyella caseinilytica]
MTKDLQQKLKDHWDSFTASEQKIANYLLRNIRDLPFETAASLSKHVGVSQMTVGRFLRNLGYDGVGDLKEELRGEGTWRQLYKEPEQPKDTDAIAAHLQSEIRALTDVHALTGSKEWKSVVKLLVSADRVSVASFQHAAFLGLSFAKTLEQLRSNVFCNTGTDGAYVDMLLDSTRNSCIVLIDMRRYFKQFRALAEEVVARGIPLIMITDTDCYWARELTPHVLMIQASWVWHSYSAYMTLFSLLATSVVQEKGEVVMDRLGDINQLRQKLVGYMGASSSKVREPVASSGKMPDSKRTKVKPRK